MQRIIPALKQNIVFFGGFLTLLISCLLLLIFKGTDAGFISHSDHHPFYLNVFFINYTFIGDGIFALCLVATMFFYFKEKKTGFALVYSLLISGLAVQVIKNLANTTVLKIYFEAGTYLNFMDDAAPSNSSTVFPSGHTATAFAIATLLVLIVKSRWMQLPLLLGVVLLGYSRMYLAQHFLMDVITGALIGTVSGVLSFYLVQNRITIKISMENIYQSPSGSISSPADMQTF